MIVESIRLQHIKSYGAGPTGSGVTVAFQPGVNRIAGVNGCGKTTIVEALGYALFSALPVFEENFKAETYLLAHGAKAGEIDVTFTADGASYRLERGVGQQSKRRSKVVELADGSICAEGDKEVAAFLCALLKLPSPERLTELFSKLVGVKQGRLVWPFDSKPKNAKDFFEPLLEVEVFRQCFDRLKPVVDAFAEDRAGQEKRHAVLAERIRERADAGARLEAAGQDVQTHAASLQRATDALGKAQAERDRQERLERDVNDAVSARDKAAAAMQLTTQGRKDAEERVRESEGAVGRVNASEPGYLAYRAAEQALKALEERRKTRDELRREREKASADVTRLAAARDSSRRERDLLLGQQEEKRAACGRAAADLSALNEDLASTAAAFERGQREAEAASHDVAVLAAWVKGLPALVARLSRLSSAIADANDEVSGWDPGKLAEASEQRLRRAKALDESRAAATKTGERIATFRLQLERLAGGVCPFLGERCEQFDPDKVQDDVSRLEAVLVEERLAVESARLAHEQAEADLERLVAQDQRLKVKRDRLERDVRSYAAELLEVLPASASAALEALAPWAPGIAPVPAIHRSDRPVLAAADVEEAQRLVGSFADEVANWWPGAGTCLDERAREAAAANIERKRNERDAQNLAVRVGSLGEEIRVLGENAAARESEATRLDGELDLRRNDVVRLDECLAPHDGLDAGLDEQRRVAEENKGPYEGYLLAKPLADDLQARRDRLDELQRQGADLAGRLAECEELLNKARAAFDPARLVEAKSECEKRSGEVAGAKADLQHAQIERDTQERRFAEWHAAVAESSAVEGEIARVTAAIELTELARKTLRDAAPAVAQHLCTRIAERAQALYNQINPDPLELAWDAERYSLRITPGDRRFAMLSGGEQTKLALAMTLAMVEEFSRLRFCVFDEPTYGVDADSRRKLADAILQVQDAAGLDQLLLVSHDDAFEGRIEHTVLLTKSAAGGTAVEVQ